MIQVFEEHCVIPNCPKMSHKYRSNRATKTLENHKQIIFVPPGQLGL